MHDWAPSEMAVHKQMPPDLLRKIAKVSFISAEVCQEGLGHCSCHAAMAINIPERFVVRAPFAYEFVCVYVCATHTHMPQT